VAVGIAQSDSARMHPGNYSMLKDQCAKERSPILVRRRGNV